MSKGGSDNMATSLRLIAIALISAAAVSNSALAADAPAPAAPSAPAACPPPGSPDAQIAVITMPKWLHTPSGTDMIDLFPPFEYKQQRNGKAMMDCAVADDGKLENCRILQEDPPGHGYGAASLKLSKIYRMTPLAQFPDWTALSECVRKAGHPHIVMPVAWKTHF